MSKKKAPKLAQAFTGPNGEVHPIRDSSGYSNKKAGEKSKHSSHSSSKKKR